MILYPKDIIKTFDEGRFIEVVSLPDAGTTSAMLSLTKILPDKMFLFVDFENMAKVGASRLVEEKNTAFILLKPDQDKNQQNLIKFLTPILKSREFDYVIIDNFALYILNRPFKAIKRLINDLNGLSDVYSTKIVLINQFRHDINNLDENGHAPLVPLYRKYIDPSVDTRITVTKTGTDISLTITKRPEKTRLFNF